MGVALSRWMMTRATPMEIPHGNPQALRVLLKFLGPEVYQGGEQIGQEFGRQVYVAYIQ